MKKQKINKTEITNNELFEDFLNLCEKYSEKMPVHELGFAMTTLVSKMLFDCVHQINADSALARETIEAGIKRGFEWSEKCGHEENKS